MPNLIPKQPTKGSLKETSLSSETKAQVKEIVEFAKSHKNVKILLTGESETGKTQAAEMIAVELALPLYRVDLSTVISKYIGETEKNLNKLFDNAEKKGWILLFDEADALFSKRPEPSPLIKSLENYKGLVILASDSTEKFNPTFLRQTKSIHVGHSSKPKKKEDNEED